MVEILQGLDFNALFVTLIAWLSANLGTIILFAVKYLKLKGKELKEKAEHNRTMEEMEARYNAKLEETYEKFLNKMNDVEGHVIKKMVDMDAEQKKEIEAETVRLEDAIYETKKTLDINDILED